MYDRTFKKIYRGLTEKIAVNLYKTQGFKFSIFTILIWRGNTSYKSVTKGIEPQPKITKLEIEFNLI